MMLNAWGRRHIVAGALILSATLTANYAHADTYPSKPVRLLVGAGAGSAPDIIARLVANRLSQVWRSSVYVENRTGAAGSIVAEAAATASADGYTLLFVPTAILAINQFTQAKLAVQPATDFDPVVFIGDLAMLIAVNPKLPVNNLAELLSYVKGQPGPVDYATPSFGGVAHLTGELEPAHRHPSHPCHLFQQPGSLRRCGARRCRHLDRNGIPTLAPHARRHVAGNRGHRTNPQRQPSRRSSPCGNVSWVDRARMVRDYGSTGHPPPSWISSRRTSALS